MSLKEKHYSPQPKVLPEYRYIHGDPLLDFSDEDVDEDVDAKEIELREVCDDWSVKEFCNIDIDISEDLLLMLVQKTARYLIARVKPCSFDIWQQKYGDIEEIEDLHELLGECLINDEIVEAIIAGCSAVGFREPYYGR